MQSFKQALVLSSALVSFAVGCGGGAEELVKAAEAYETATCACKDVACTTKAATDYASATQALAGKKLTPSEADAKKITDASTKAAECTTKIAMAAIPGAQ